MSPPPYGTTGKLLEAIVESVDAFHSENLAQEVTHRMREATSRGFFLGSRAPFGLTQQGGTSYGKRGQRSALRYPLRMV